MWLRKVPRRSPTECSASSGIHLHGRAIRTTERRLIGECRPASEDNNDGNGDKREEQTSATRRMPSPLDGFGHNSIQLSAALSFVIPTTRHCAASAIGVRAHLIVTGS